MSCSVLQCSHEGELRLGGGGGVEKLPEWIQGQGWERGFREGQAASVWGVGLNSEMECRCLGVECKGRDRNCFVVG